MSAPIPPQPHWYKPRLIEAYYVPFWPKPSSGVKPAEVEYFGPWPDGGNGTCVKLFHADTVDESNRQARTFLVALEMARVAQAPVTDSGDFWEIAA